MATGTVKWYNAEKGHGLIAAEDGGHEVFVEHSALTDNGYHMLDEGQRVEFDVTQGQHGVEAQNVRTL